MKTLLVLLLLTASAAANDTNHTLITEGKVAVEWHFYDEHRVWLSVNSYSGHDWANDGYNPSFTYIRCQYKPMVKKLLDGQYQITFASEIMEGVP